MTYFLTLLNPSSRLSVLRISQPSLCKLTKQNFSVINYYYCSHGVIFTSHRCGFISAVLEIFKIFIEKKGIAKGITIRLLQFGFSSALACLNISIWTGEKLFSAQCYCSSTGETRELQNINKRNFDQNSNFEKLLGLKCII